MKVDNVTYSKNTFCVRDRVFKNVDQYGRYSIACQYMFCQGSSTLSKSLSFFEFHKCILSMGYIFFILIKSEQVHEISAILDLLLEFHQVIKFKANEKLFSLLSITHS